jgi:hypothetical protein
MNAGQASIGPRTPDDGSAAGTVEIAANVQAATNLAVTATAPADFNGGSQSDFPWRNANGDA